MRSYRIAQWITALIITLSSYPNPSFAQVDFYDIDFYRIPQKKIRSLIQHQMNKNIIQFDDIRPTISKNEDFTGYRQHTKTYLIKKDISRVWEGYKSANPSNAWNGKIASFGVLLSKKTNSILYRNSKFDKIDTGQVYYINLKIMKGVYNLPVVFEIVTVDNENKILEFSYVNGTVSKGKQRIHLTGTSEGYTEIKHTSLFKSHSPFRDRILYPHFHRLVIDEFHKNIKEKIIYNAN